MPETRYFDLGPKFAAFGTQRFDVAGDHRVPVQSLAAVLNADFRMPSSLDYGKFQREPGS
jgi:serine/threonine-protein kinase HipA